MKKVLIFSFFLFAVPYGVFCSKSETCELWRLSKFNRGERVWL